MMRSAEGMRAYETLNIPVRKSEAVSLRSGPRRGGLLNLPLLCAERGSPKFEKAALRWLERYLKERLAEAAALRRDHDEPCAARESISVGSGNRGSDGVSDATRANPGRRCGPRECPCPQGHGRTALHAFLV